MFRAALASVKLSLVATVGVLLAGCGVPSIHPLCGPADLTTEPGILGVWSDPQNSDKTWTWKFFQKPGANTYTLIYIESGVPAKLGAHLTRIGTYIYMDTFLKTEDNEAEPDKKEKPGPFDNILLLSHLVGGHLFWRIEVQGDILRIAWLNQERLKSALEAKTATVAHEWQEPGEGEDRVLILTAPTEDLRQFVLKSADEVFDVQPTVLHRRTPKGASPAVKP